MATNRFFDNTGLSVTKGELAKAAQLNSVTNETNAAFELIESEIDLLENQAIAAYAWANYDQGTEIDGIANPSEYSSKANAQEAQAWASGTAGVSTTADGTTTIPYSANEKAAEASGYADTATAQATIATTQADLAEDWAISPTDVTPGNPSAKTSADSAAASELNADASSITAEGWSNVAATQAGISQVAATEAIQAKDDAETAQGLAEGYRDSAQADANAATAALYSTVVAKSQAQGYAEDTAADAIATGNDVTSAQLSASAAASSAVTAAAAAGVDVSAISENLSANGEIRGVFFYDTSKDSDGGAWRKRCSNLSWYKENTSSTRGATREFPALALIVVEEKRLVIYDATDPDVPMWMVFTSDNVNNWLYTYDLRKARMLNGVLTIAGDLVAVSINFLTDSNIWYDDGTTIGGFFPGTIKDRTAGLGFSYLDTPDIVSRSINDVAMTVLPEAPVDLTTGLPVPTIAVATDGGVSVIDGPAGVGTVVDITYSSEGQIGWVEFTQDNYIRFGHGASATIPWHVRTEPIPSVDDLANSPTAQNASLTYHTASQHLSVIAAANLAYLGESTNAAALCGSGEAVGTIDGLSLLKDDFSDGSNGMVAYITDEYNTGWMHGDVKLATLADTTAESIGQDTTTELLQDTTWDTTDGWTADSGSITATGNIATVTNPDGAGGIARQEITGLTIGQRYRIICRINGVDTTGTVYLMDSANSVVVDYFQASVGLNLMGHIDFTANETSAHIRLQNGSTTLGHTVEYGPVQLWQIGSELVTGDTVVDDETGWEIFGGGFSIGSGVAVGNGAVTGLNQPNVFNVGNEYRQQISVTNYTSGSAGLYNGGAGSLLVTLDSAGIKTGTGEIDGSNGTFTLYASGPVSATFDDAYVWLAGAEEASGRVAGDEGADWTLGDGWSIGSGVASVDGSQVTSQSAYTELGGGSRIGKDHRVQYSLSGYSAGTFVPSVGGTGTYVAADGIFTDTIESASNNFLNFSANADFIGDVDDAWVWEAGPELVTNGTFDTDTTGWTPSGTGTISVISGELKVENGLGTIRAYQNITTEAGEIYEITGDIGSSGSSDGRFAYGLSGGSVISGSSGVLGVGSHTMTFKATGTTSSIILYSASGSPGADTFFDNISVRKITDVVENGEFSSDRAWSTFGTSWSISPGVGAVSTGAGADDLYMNGGIPVSTDWYIFQVECSAYTSGYVYLKVGGTTYGHKYIDGTGVYSFVVRSGGLSDDIGLVNSGGAPFVGTIKNIRIYEAEKVNGTWQPAGNLTSNPSFEGEWIDSNQWTPVNDALLSVVEGNMRVAYDGTNFPYMYQQITGSIGDVYEVTFDYVGGDTARFRLGSTLTGNEYWNGFSSSPGSYKQTVRLVGSGNLFLRLEADVSGAGYSDFNNVSIRKVTDVIGDGELWNTGTDATWPTLGSGVTFNSGQIDVNNGAPTYALQAGGVTEIGETYIAQFEVFNYVSGSVTVYCGAGSNQWGQVTGDGVYKKVFKSIAGTLGFYFGGTPNLSVRNLKVYKATEVDGQWVPEGNLVVNPSFEGTGDLQFIASDATVEYENGYVQVTNDLNSQGFCYHAFSTEAGAVYELTFDAPTNSVGTDLLVGVGGAGGIPADWRRVITDGTTDHNFQFQGTGADVYVYFAPNNTSAGGTGNFSNVSFRKVENQVLPLPLESAASAGVDLIWSHVGSTTVDRTVTFSGSGGNMYFFSAPGAATLKDDTVYHARCNVLTNDGDVRLCYYDGVDYIFVASLTGGATGILETSFVPYNQDNSSGYFLLRADAGTNATAEDIEVYEGEPNTTEFNWHVKNNFVSNGFYDGIADGSVWIVNSSNKWRGRLWDGELLAYAGTVVYQQVQTPPLVRYNDYELAFNLEASSGSPENRLTAGSGGLLSNFWSEYDLSDGLHKAIFEYNSSTYANVGFAYSGSTSQEPAPYSKLLSGTASFKGSRNLVINGEFSRDVSWTKGTGWTIASGVASCDGSQVANSGFSQNNVAQNTGKYLVSFDLTISAGQIRLFLGSTGTETWFSGAGAKTFIMDGDSGSSGAFNIQADPNFVGTIDNVTVYELTEPDRSVNDNPLQVVGELEKTPAATGADLVKYSGFTDTDYLLLPDASDLDFGTGDFHTIFWLEFNDAGTSQIVFSRDDTPNTDQLLLYLTSGVGQPVAYLGNATNQLVGPDEMIAGQKNLVAFWRENGTAYCSVNAGTPTTRSNATALDFTNGLAIGRQITATGSPLSHSYISLFRMGAGAPSADQIEYIYNTEKHLFTENNVCTLGIDLPITDMDYDPTTDTLIVASGSVSDPPRRNLFQGLSSLDGTKSLGSFVPYGSTQVAMLRGREAMAGDYTNITIPAFNLREELEDKDRQVAFLSSPIVGVYEAGPTQSVTLEPGWKCVRVFNSSGQIVAESNWSQSYNGFRWTVDFGAAAAWYYEIRRI